LFLALSAAPALPIEGSRQGASQVARQVSVLHSHPSIKVHAHSFKQMIMIIIY
jgi:hypothetical protein